MKFTSVTAVVCLVSMVSTSQAAPSQPSGPRFETRSQELESRSPDENKSAVLAKRALWHWAAGAAVVAGAVALHKWHKDRKAQKQNQQGNAPTQNTDDASSQDPASGYGRRSLHVAYEKRTLDDAFGGLSDLD
ncbi:hypothetical protein H0H93_016257 [Arthromyces matolae]|nr:hypothetical protein H0H93_016257 [Arthromyces matolae]